jgi:hypothetical protein
MELADQVRRAIAWVYRNAVRFGIDPTRLYVGGQSSGGHLAAVALTTDWPRDFGLRGTSSKAPPLQDCHSAVRDRRQEALGDVCRHDKSSLASCRPSHRRNSWQRWSKPCCSRSRRRWQAGRSSTKITADHLGRGAFVYIRQSTADQLLHNPESRRRQYGLADRAQQLGWTTVEVIDDDLGRSGGGINRPGFERLLAAICAGRVGAVFAIEASRLARNGLWSQVHASRR